MRYLITVETRKITPSIYFVCAHCLATGERTTINAFSSFEEAESSAFRVRQVQVNKLEREKAESISQLATIQSDEIYTNLV